MKKTKKALVLSALCLLMCFTMLIGTTFAWFTDKVEVTGNRIVAGNLDVEMEYMNANGVWADVETAGTNSFFTDIDGGELLWEPGVVSYAHFKVSNVGNLALKYNFSTVADDFNTVDGHSLKEVIEVYFIKQGSTAPAAYADRAAVETAINGLTAVGFDGFANENTNLAPETDEYFTVVLKWTPGATDNDYNVNNDKVTSDGKDFLWIDIDLTLVATQATAEVDSFDDQYDKDAPATKVSTFDALSEVLSNGGKAKLDANIDATQLTPKNQRIDIPAGADVTIDLNGHTITDKDGGQGHWMAIYVGEGANLVINDTAGNGKIVSSCYGIYVKQNATVTMNAGTLVVSGNNVYDMGVVLYNGSFIMNGGTIDAKIGICASNYYKNIDPTLPVNRITIGENAVINATDQDINLCQGESDEALDTVIVDNRVNP